MPTCLSRVVLCIVVLATVVGCRHPTTSPPARAQHLAPHSAVLADADVLVAAMEEGNGQRIREWMNLELRGRTSREKMNRAMAGLRSRFGHPQGVLEERTFREGNLLWYSGLWVYRREARGRRPGRPARVTPVLYQFALDPQRRIARLVIREHVFIEQVVPPAERYVPVTRLHFVSRGEWTVSNGGRRREDNRHHGSRGQRFAYDIVVKHNGRRSRPGSDPKDNRSYYCYGQELRAPAAGTVKVAIDGIPENVPGVRGRGGGNGVVIDHGFGEYSALWHAIPGSVQVKQGDEVEAGQLVAKVGNSGRSSGPHIHFHLNSHGFGVADFGLPAPFVEVWVDGRWRERAEPIRGQRVSADPPAGVRRRDQAGGPRVFVDL